MKTTFSLMTILTALVLTPALCAQVCGPTPVVAWTGAYSMSGIGSGGDLLGEYTWTVEHNMSGSPDLVGAQLGCPTISWTGTDTFATGSANDLGTEDCTGGGSTTIAYNGSGPPVVSLGGLALNVLGFTYQFYDAFAIIATITTVGCPPDGGTQSDPLPYFLLSPLELGCAGDLTFPSYVLPPFVGPLAQSGVPLNGAADCPWGISTDWDMSFGLYPIYVWDSDCPPPWVVNSTIGCENQSLGEDVLVSGTGFDLHYQSDRAVGASGDAIAGADAAMIGGWTLSVHHAYDPSTGTLFLGDGRQRNGYQLGTPVSFNGNLLLTSEDGSEVYVFSSTGQHLQTLRPLTGALEYQFAYDSAGKLITVTDASGNVTTIQRNASEQPTAIVSPYGQTTTLSVDSNGFLSQLTDPLGNSQTFVNTSGGLLTSRTDQNGNIFNYTYDSNGRLTKDADPLGGYVAASSTNAASGFGQTVTLTTAMGKTSSYQSTAALPWAESSTSTVSQQRTITWPDGLQASSSENLQNGQLSDTYSLPDGTSDSETLGPDPVWGLQVPVDTSETVTQGNLTMNITGSRSTALGTAGNPFTVTTETDVHSINDRTYSSTFTGSSLTWVNTSPVGRTLTVGLDSLERIASTQVEGLTATDFAYDSHGRLASATQGTRQTTLSYGSNGFLASVTDPLQLTTSFSYDADGHLLTTTLPDGRVINYSYDANGNLTSVTPPGKSAHDFAYNAVNLATSYTPPTVVGTGPTTYAYDLDRDLTTITRSDGETINLGYDTAGRLISIGTPTGTTSFTYDTTTGNLDSLDKGSEKISYSYNGPLPTKSTWKGTVAGSVSRKYNDNFWATSQGIAGGSSIAFDYDNDGLVTKAGSLTIKRSPKNGLITGTTLGVATESRTYDSFGELIGYTASVSGTAIYSVQYTRDADGRVTAKTETINGTTNTYSYTYDPAGRLTGATKNSATDTYTYDTNSNRLSGTTSSGTSSGTYDAQDRLLTYGTTSYTYTANGELESQKVGSQKTTYKYDVLGNLIAATLPNANKLAYIIDGETHRVGKELNGALETGFLYDGGHILAQLNTSNQVVSQFVYATGANSPDYMVSGGVTYRIFSDQLGSPVLIVNTSTGAIAEQITYDEFGNILSDTNPGFQPFGFAGGLYDQDLKLVRFGARDYNPAVGRWTAKDPILFNGGDTNLYGYVLNDPVNMIDPAGLQASDCPCKQTTPKSLQQQTEESAQKVADNANGPFSTPGKSGGSGNSTSSVPTPSVSVGGGVSVGAGAGTVSVSGTFTSQGGTKGEWKVELDPKNKTLTCSGHN